MGSESKKKTPNKKITPDFGTDKRGQKAHFGDSLWGPEPVGSHNGSALSVESIVPGSCLDQGHRRGQETGPGASHARQLSLRTIGEVLSRVRLSKTTIY